MPQICHTEAVKQLGGVCPGNGANNTPTYTNTEDPAAPEGFSIQGINVDLVLKAIFFGAIFYLLSLPDVYKMTKKCCKSVDGVLLHSIVFAVIYFIVVHFI